MGLTVEPNSGILLFDEFNGTNQIQTHNSAQATSSQGFFNLFFAVWGIDTCAHPTKQVELTVETCNAQGFSPSVTKTLEYDPNILTYFDNSFNDPNVDLPALNNPWPDNKILVATWSRLDLAQGWISVSSPHEKWRAALLMMHYPAQ